MSHKDLTVIPSIMITSWKFPAGSSGVLLGVALSTISAIRRIQQASKMGIILIHECFKCEGERVDLSFLEVAFDVSLK
jgi:hypothetical protein